MRIKPLLLFLAISVSSLASNAIAQRHADNVELGFDVDVKAFAKDRSEMPTIQSMKVKAISQGSSASRTSLAIGDEIIEVDGFVIPGSTLQGAWEAKQKIKPLQNITIKVKKPDGRTQVIEMVSGPITRA